MKVVVCNYVTIKNLTFIGDKADRSWANSDEKYHDITYGMFVGGQCQHVTIENIDTSLFMADGLTAGSYDFTVPGSKINPSVSYNFGWALGALDSNGNPIASTTNCVTNFIQVSGNTPIYLQGYGYTQGFTGFTTPHYQIYCYDANKVFITQLPDTYVLRSFVTPKNCVYIKLVNYESSVDVNGWQGQLKTGYLGQFITIKDCYIHHNHRGGMSIGVNDMYFENNYFYNNGLATAMDYENNVPTFPASTLYHINMEDSKAFNINFTDNVFKGGRLGIAFRGWDYNITNNNFMDCSALIMYKVPYVVASGNYFQNAGTTTFTYNTSDGVLRDWIITENIFMDSSVLVYGNAEIDTFSSNILNGNSTVTFPGNVRNLRDNTFHCDTDVGYGSILTVIAGQVIEGCNFVKNNTTVQNQISLTNVTVLNCNFNNLKLNVSGTFKDCRFTDCGFAPGTNTLLLENCTVNKTGVAINNKYAGSNNSALVWVSADGTSVIFRNCTITDANTENTFSVDNNSYVYNTNVTLINTTLTKNGSNNLGFDKVKGTLTFDNATIINNGSAITYTPSSTLRHQFKDCNLTNVTFVMKTSDIYYNQADVGLQSGSLPSSGAFLLGQRVRNSSPTPGGSEGWVCTTSGIACTNAWAPKADYVANYTKSSTVASGGNLYNSSQVYSGSNVYQAVRGGHSSFATAPTFPATLNARVDDVAGALPWAASKQYNLGDMVLPPLGVTDPTTLTPTLTLVPNANSTVQTVKHYVQFTWVNAVGETMGSAEANITVTTGNNLSITVPAFPTGVTKANIYISTTSGQNRWQGSINATGGSLVISAPINTIGFFAPLTSSNGYWYECTQAGTSGATAPTWATSGTVTDNTAKWTPRSICTWQNVGTLAVFKEFGVISM
jgi:hypothetical protein